MRFSAILLKSNLTYTFSFDLSDLFEVVDRRAKLVVSELADEQSDSKSPGLDFSSFGLYLLHLTLNSCSNV